MTADAEKPEQPANELAGQHPCWCCPAALMLALSCRGAAVACSPHTTVLKLFYSIFNEWSRTRSAGRQSIGGMRWRSFQGSPQASVHHVAPAHSNLCRRRLIKSEDFSLLNNNKGKDCGNVGKQFFNDSAEKRAAKHLRDVWFVSETRDHVFLSKPTRLLGAGC